MFTRRFPTLPAIERRHGGASVTVDGIDVRLSNLDKVFWPSDGITKGDLVAYYMSIAPAILPYLRHRPLAMRRMPDGIDGVDFFEDPAPSWTPEWVTRCAVESADGDVDALVIVEDAASLVFCANSGASICIRSTRGARATTARTTSFSISIPRRLRGSRTRSWWRDT
jgi:hypothetical protein